MRMLEERPQDFLIRSFITPENNHCTMTVVHLPSRIAVNGETRGSQIRLREELLKQISELLEKRNES
jgi:hypothetical protein